MSKEAPPFQTVGSSWCQTAERWGLGNTLTVRLGQQRDGLGFALLPETFGEIEKASALLLAGDHDAGEHTVDQGPQQRLVAAADFARDHCRPQHALSRR